MYLQPLEGAKKMTIGDVIKEFRKLNDLNLEEFGNII